MKKEKEDDKNVGMYESLTEEELKNMMVRRWKEIKSLEAEKKDYVKSVSDTVKELSSQIDDIVYWVGIRQTKAEREKLVEATNKALEG